MKTANSLTAALAVALLLPLGTALAAEPAATAPAAEQAAPTAAEDGKDSPKKAHRAKATDHRCTASRIRKDKAVDCEKTAAPTRTYTQEDIQQTGETDIGQALRKLDPRFY